MADVGFAYTDLRAFQLRVLLQDPGLLDLDVFDDFIKFLVKDHLVEPFVSCIVHEGVLHLRAPGEVVEVINEVGVHRSVLLLFVEREGHGGADTGGSQVPPGTGDEDGGETDEAHDGPDEGCGRQFLREQLDFC